ANARWDAAPRLDPAYLTDERDTDTLVRGVRVALEIADQPSLRHLRTDAEPPVNLRSSARDVEHFVRAHAQTQYHPVGTCRMGNDDVAVVDAALRVRGVDGVRVGDASVVPAMTTGNIQ